MNFDDEIIITSCISNDLTFEFEKILDENEDINKLNYLIYTLNNLSDDELVTFKNAIRYRPFQKDKLTVDNFLGIAKNINCFKLYKNVYRLYDLEEQIPIEFINHVLINELVKNGHFTPEGFVMKIKDYKYKFEVSELPTEYRLYVFNNLYEQFDDLDRKIKIYLINETDHHKQSVLTLPTGEKEFKDAMNELDINPSENVSIKSATCSIPHVARAFLGLKNINRLNYLANIIEGFTQKELKIYVALVGSKEGRDRGLYTTEDYINLALNIDSYMLSEEIKNDYDVAISHLDEYFSEWFIGEVEEFLDIEAYGACKREQPGKEGTHTPFGYIERLGEYDHEFNVDEIPEEYKLVATTKKINP